MRSIPTLLVFYIALSAGTLLQAEQPESATKVKPIVIHDEKANVYFYVESNGRYVTAFSSNGKVLWHRDPFKDANMAFHRIANPTITSIAQYETPIRELVIRYTSSQMVRVNEQTGEASSGGQD